jgi:hypothetical protein
MLKSNDVCKIQNAQPDSLHMLNNGSTNNKQECEIIIKR